MGEIRACNDSCIYYAAAAAAAAAAADDDDDDDDDEDDEVGFFSSKVAVFFWEGATSKRTIRENLGLQLNHAWLMHGLLETHHENPRFSTLISIFSPSASGTCSPWENPWNVLPMTNYDDLPMP